MKQYVEIFNEIKSESGRIAKEQLLKKHENVEGLKEILQFVYNPLIKSGLAAKKINKMTNVKPTRKLKTIFECIEYVKENNTGNDEVIANIQYFLSTLVLTAEVELAVSILTKDLPIGLSRTTLNKVYGADFIRKFEVMLASKFDPERIDLDRPFALTLKIDGNRTVVFNYESGPVFYSRSGKEIEGLVELAEQFKQMPKGLVYDGEIIADRDDLSSDEQFRLTQTLVRSKGEKKGLRFVWFDVLSIEEFNNGISDDVYEVRFSKLREILNTHQHLDLIHQVPMYYQGNDLSKIQSELDIAEADGYEGLMLNFLDSKYETKRTKGLLKIKTFYTCDLMVTGVNEEVRGGKCGSLSVDYQGFNLNVPILKQTDQKYFWENQDKIIGRVIEVKYFEESENAQEGKSLRFPSFVRVREPEKEVSLH